MLLQGLQHLLVAQGMAVGPGADGPFPEAQVLIGDHQVRVDDRPGAQAAAPGAGPLGAVEGKEAGREFRQADPAVVAGEFLAEQQFLAPRDGHPHHPFGQPQRQLQGVGEPGGQVRLDDQPVHHRLDGIAAVFIQERAAPPAPPPRR